MAGDGGRSLQVSPALADALTGAVEMDDVWRSLGAAASRAAGSSVWAVLRLDNDGRCRREADDGSGLPDVIPGEVWRLASAKPNEPGVGWPVAGEQPNSLSVFPAWERGFAVAVPGTATRRLLALGSPERDDLDARTITARLAAMAGPAARVIELTRSATRARALLERVTELATGLAGADDPAGLLHALVEGVSSIDVVDAAAVWNRGEDGVPVLGEGSEVVMAHDVDEGAMRRIAGAMEPGADPVRLSRFTRAGVLPDGRLLSLFPVGERRARVLGLIHARPLDDDERGVFSTLVGTIGPAIRQAEMGVERSTLIAAFGRVLRPHDVPEGVDIGVEHHANTTAAETFGGDFYDWFTPAPMRVLLALGDVSGKGIPAAAASSMAVWSLRAIGRQGTGPSVIARLMDTAVAEELGEDRFVTLALLDTDLDTWRARLVLAGHPRPILVPDPPRALEITADRPLGVMPDGPAFTSHELDLQPGQTVVLFTDGVTDGVDVTGERLGRDRLEVMVSDALQGATDAQALATSLWARVRAWVGGTPDDDCAILVLRRPLS